jgi:hypothetical protein
LYSSLLPWKIFIIGFGIIVTIAGAFAWFVDIKRISAADSEEPCPTRGSAGAEGVTPANEDSVEGAAKAVLVEVRLLLAEGTAYLRHRRR